MGKFDCEQKRRHRDYAGRAFLSVRAKDPSLTRMVFVDTPCFDATKYFINVTGLDPNSLVAVCWNQFEIAPPAGITSIQRNVYELKKTELTGVAVAWLDTCVSGIGYSRDWFKNDLDLFADVPVVMVVHALRGSRFRRHPDDVLPFYLKLHEHGVRKGVATQVVPYTGAGGSSMTLTYSFLSGFEVQPFKAKGAYMKAKGANSGPAPTVEEDNGEEDEEEGEEEGEEDDGDEKGEEDEEEGDLSTAAGDEEGEEDEEEEDLSTNGPPSKRLRSVRGVGVLPRRGMEWCDDVGWVPQAHVKRIQVIWRVHEGGGWCKETPFNGTLVINNKKKCVVEYDDGERVKHVKGGRMCLSTFPSWKVLC